MSNKKHFQFRVQSPYFDLENTVEISSNFDSGNIYNAN